MMGREIRDAPSGVDQSLFATTHWSDMLAAANEDSAQAAALEQLCRTYWHPLYSYIRRRGYGHEDAEDLTQSFFARLLRKDLLRHAGPEKGRFGSYLLTCLNHFLADEWEKTRTVKRGGAVRALTLGPEQAGGRYRLETPTEASAETLHERRWALDLLSQVLNQLRAEAVASGRATLFDQLQGCLVGERPEQTYAELGERLGLSETVVKVTVHRLRQRYRELLRQEIAQTVAQPEEIEAELRYMFEVVSR